jgi:PAB-dependent poly(A)-specific ribonuclease subunit 3
MSRCTELCADAPTLCLWHVFQVDGDGLPILDAGHVLTALNKLDAGDPEEILLSSRDGKDLLVVSYADVQR